MHGKFQTSFDTVRLMRTELGVQVPRAMESIIARNEVLMAGISKLSSLMVGIGAGMIAFSFGKEIFDGVDRLYEKWLDVDGAIDSYNAKAAEAAQKNFYQNAGIDQLNADLQTANDQLDKLKSKRADSPGWLASAAAMSSGVYAPGQQGVNPYGTFTTGDAQKLDTNQGQSDEDKLRLLEATHKSNLQKIQNQRILDEASARGLRRAQIQEQSAFDEASENKQYRVGRDKKLAEIADRGKQSTDQGYVTVVPNAGRGRRAGRAQAGAGAIRCGPD